MTSRSVAVCVMGGYMGMNENLKPLQAGGLPSTGALTLSGARTSRQTGLSRRLGTRLLTYQPEIFLLTLLCLCDYLTIDLSSFS